MIFFSFPEIYKTSFVIYWKNKTKIARLFSSYSINVEPVNNNIILSYVWVIILMITTTLVFHSTGFFVISAIIVLFYYCHWPYHPGQYALLVSTKPVDSNFRMFWLAPVTWNILGYSLFCKPREKWRVVSEEEIEEVYFFPSDLVN